MQLTTPGLKYNGKARVALLLVFLMRGFLGMPRPDMAVANKDGKFAVIW